MLIASMLSLCYKVLGRQGLMTCVRHGANVLRKLHSMSEGNLQRTLQFAAGPTNEEAILEGHFVHCAQTVKETRKNVNMHGASCFQANTERSDRWWSIACYITMCCPSRSCHQAITTDFLGRILFVCSKC